MAKRDELFKHFGPKLFEAFVEMILDELNNLRIQANLSAQTKERFMDEINNRLVNLASYNWMSD